MRRVKIAYFNHVQFQYISFLRFHITSNFRTIFFYDGHLGYVSEVTNRIYLPEIVHRCSLLATLNTKHQTRQIAYASELFSSLAAHKRFFDV